MKCPQEYPIPGPCCSRDGPSHSQILCHNSPSFSVLQQSKSWRVTEQPLQWGAVSAQRCCHKAWVGPRAPKTCNSKTPLRAAAAPETLTVAERGGRAKGSPLAMGLAPMLCNGLKKCVSAMLWKAWSTGAFLCCWNTLISPTRIKPKPHGSESLLNGALNK